MECYGNIEICLIALGVWPLVCLLFSLRFVSHKISVHDDITVMPSTEYSLRDVSRSVWSDIMQFLFNIQLIINVLNTITLLRSLSPYLLPSFITVKNVKRSCIRFRVKMLYSADKFIGMQFMSKIFLLEII
jgi:hypothetical protein